MHEGLAWAATEMHEYETFAYLDVPKTGSSFISYLLRNYCTEQQVFFKKHGGIRNRHDPGKFYFISVRDPLDQYISLYSSGCGREGSLYQRLEKRGYGDFYNSSWRGFKRWLKFVLEPANAKYLRNRSDRVYSGPLSEILGYQSYRFLKLTLLDPAVALATCRTKDDVREAYETANVANDAVRHETFQDDLKRLLTTRIRESFSDLDAAIAFIDSEVKVNASDRVDRLADYPKLGRRGSALVEEREWFLRELFGY
jgi:hypothetical protein